VEIQRCPIPLEDALATELSALWVEVFDPSYSSLPAEFSGAEEAFNRDLVFVGREGGRLAGSVHLTISRKTPSLGGLGEVATHRDFRGQGVAWTLCTAALEEFESLGGRALFLGTSNPAAERVYARLGFHRLPNSNIFARFAGGGTADEFYAEYFAPGPSGEVSVGSPAERIDMIPLIACPHPAFVLDVNVGLTSTQYVLQPYCMGLYPRYEKLALGGGNFFALRNGQGRLVGLATAAIDERVCRLDGFTHPAFEAGLPVLLKTARDWATRQSVESVIASVSGDDPVKRRAFAALDLKID